MKRTLTRSMLSPKQTVSSRQLCAVASIGKKDAALFPELYQFYQATVAAKQRKHKVGHTKGLHELGT